MQVCQSKKTKKQTNQTCTNILHCSIPVEKTDLECNVSPASSEDLHSHTHPQPNPSLPFSISDAIKKIIDAE